MSSSICLRCLTRSLTSIEQSAAPTVHNAQRAAFSTTSSLAATPPKKKGAAAKPSSRQGRTLKLSKNTRASTGKPPAPGERKAIRKRVVLSNTNALEVQGLEDLDKRNAAAERLEQAKGSVVGLTNETVDALRALEAFKPTQGWSLFRRPAVLVREETVALAKDLESLGGEQKKSVRRVVFGERGSGKSVLQLQAMTMAQLKGWVVVHFPEGQDLTNASTSYQSAQTPSGETIYIQPHYTATLLAAFAKANQAVLSKLTLSQKHDLPIPVQSNISLDRFAELGSRDPDLAWPIWQALWSELLAPAQQGDGLQRPPVFVSMDSANHVMRQSAYLDSEVKPIHALDLALPRFFGSLLSGHIKLPNGGMVLAATSESNRAASPTLDHILSSKHAEKTGQPQPRWDPYAVLDQQVLNVLKDVEAQKLQGLSKEEARGVMEYYALSGMLRATVTDRLVSEKWSLSGGGIIGEIERGTVGGRF